jgi:hypothetical protein
MSYTPAVAGKPHQSHKKEQNPPKTQKPIIQLPSLTPITINSNTPKPIKASNTKPMNFNIGAKSYIPLDKQENNVNSISSPMSYISDDSEGVYYTYFFTYLKNKALEIIHTQRIHLFEERQNDILSQKGRSIAKSLKTEIQKGHEPKSHEYFLTAFQICTYLPNDYRNLVWEELSKEFKEISFEKNSLLIHTLHSLSFSRKQDFDSILSFLNLLSFIHLSDKTDELIKYSLKDVSVSIIKLSPEDLLNIKYQAAFHIKTLSGSLTLEIPLIDFYENQECECAIIPNIDLLLPLLPEWKTLWNPKVPANISLLKDFFTPKLHNLVNYLLLVPDYESIQVGLKLLIALCKSKDLDTSIFSSSLLKVLPFLKEREADFSTLFHFLKSLKLITLNNTTCIRLCGEEPAKFTKTYIQELLLHPDVATQKIALELWQTEILSSKHFSRPDLISYGSELFNKWENTDSSQFKSKQDLLIFGLKIFKELAKKTLSTEITVFAFEIFQNLLNYGAIANQEIEPLFSFIYLSLKPEIKTNFVLQKSFYIAEKLTRQYFNPYVNQTLTHNSKVLKGLIQDLLNSKQPDLAFQLFFNGLGTWISLDDKTTCSLSLKICESIFDEQIPSNIFEAIECWKMLAGTGLFNLEGNQIKEHQFIQKLLNKMDGKPDFGNMIMELIPKLFERSISQNIYSKFRPYFIKHLKNLCSLGAEAEFSRLLKTNHIDISPSELNECEIILLNNNNNIIADDVKVSVLLKMEIQSLNPEAKEFILNLSRELCIKLQTPTHLDSSLRLAAKILQSEENFLFSLLMNILKQDNVTHDTQCYAIFKIIFLGKQTSEQDKTRLLELCTQKVKTCPLPVKELIKRSHQGLHEGLISKGQYNETITLLKALLNIFTPKEIYSKQPEVWLEILNHMSNEKDEIQFKEKILKLLLENKILAKPPLFDNLRNTFHNLIHTYSSYEMKTSAIDLLIHFQTFEIFHPFNEQTLSNLHDCLAICLENKETEKCLILLKTCKKNKNFKDDSQILNDLTNYLKILFERKEYKKWIATSLEFLEFGMNDSTFSNYKTVFLGALKDSPKDNADSIFTLLIKKNHSDLNLWLELFKVIKQYNLRNLKIKLANELKKSEFQVLFILQSNTAGHCLFHMLEFLNDINDFETAHILFEKDVKRFFVLMHKLTGLTQQSKDIIPLILRKIFRYLKKQPVKKQELLNMLLPLHYRMDYGDISLEWSINKILIEACSEEDAPEYLIAGCVMAYTLILNEKFHPKQAEIINPILEIIKKWPEFDVQTVHLLIEQTMPSLKDVIGTAENTIKLLNTKLVQLTHFLFILTERDLTFFEQFHNLIQKKSEILQLQAMFLYNRSMSIIEKAEKPLISLRSLTKNTPNNMLLKLAFESQHPKIIYAALDNFLSKTFQSSLLSQDEYPFTELILNKTTEILPLLDITANEIHQLCSLCLKYFKSSMRMKKTIKIDYFNFFSVINTKVLIELEDVHLFSLNHEWIFESLLVFIEKGKLDLKPDMVAPNIIMLDTAWHLFVKAPSYNKEHHDLLYKEFKMLLKSPIVRKNALDAAFKNLVFSTDFIWENHQEVHEKALISIVPLAGELKSFESIYLLLKYQFNTKNNNPLTKSQKAEILVTLFNLMDENTPFAILARALHILKFFEQELLQDLKTLNTCLSSFFQHIKKRTEFTTDLQIESLIALSTKLFIENNNLYWLEIYKKNSADAILIYIDFIKTIQHLSSHITLNKTRMKYFNTMLNMFKIIKKNSVVFKPQEYLEYLSIYLEITMSLEKESENKDIHTLVLTALCKLSVNGQNKAKQQELFKKILIHYIEISIDRRYEDTLKNVCLQAINVKFHILYNLSDTAYKEVGELILKLRKQL